MRTFTIDVDDNITVFGASEVRGKLAQGTQRFRSERELAILAGEWLANRLVDVWNRLPGVQPVKRFTDRKTAVARIWNAVRSLEPAGAKPQPTASSKDAGMDVKAASRHHANTSGKGTRAAQMIALLERPEGASLRVVMAATGWQAHSVRGFISGHLRNKLGLRVKSFKRNGERVYAIQNRKNTA